MLAETASRIAVLNLLDATNRDILRASRQVDFRVWGRPSGTSFFESHFRTQVGETGQPKTRLSDWEAVQYKAFLGSRSWHELCCRA